MSTSSTPTPRRRRAALAVAALTMASLGAGVVHADVAAAAGKARVNATIKLTKNESQVVGKVRSPKPVCRKNIRVVLYWQEPGKQRFVPVADDQTNRRGAWEIDAPGRNIPPGRYYVKTPRSPQCQPDRSPRIRVR